MAHILHNKFIMQWQHTSIYVRFWRLHIMTNIFCMITIHLSRNKYTIYKHNCNAATFYSVSFSKPNPVWFVKVIPKHCVRFSKPIPVWFGKKKSWFCKTQIPNQIQIGLENFDDHLSFQTKLELVWKIVRRTLNKM